MNRFFAQIRPPQNPTIVFLHISEISASSVQITKKLQWKSLNSEINASKLEIWQKFRKYAKKMYFAGSNLSKESFYKLYRTPQDNLSMNPEPLLKRKFWSLRKIVKFATTRVLPVEISSGNKFQILKEGYLRYTTHKNLDSYG